MSTDLTFFDSITGDIKFSVTVTDATVASITGGEFGTITGSANSATSYVDVITDEIKTKGTFSLTFNTTNVSLATGGSLVVSNLPDDTKLTILDSDGSVLFWESLLADGNITFELPGTYTLNFINTKFITFKQIITVQ